MSSLAQRTSRPQPMVGSYWQSKALPTKIRCKAYDAPPRVRGTCLTTIEPSTTLGPVEAVEHWGDFVTILVRGYWINVWNNNIPFAFAVCPDVVDEWRSNGWQD